MKKAISILVMFLMCLIFIGFSYAGEKEEIVWEAMYYQERYTRLKVEMDFAQKAFEIAKQKLVVIETAEKAKNKKSDKKSKKKETVEDGQH